MAKHISLNIFSNTLDLPTDTNCCMTDSADSDGCYDDDDDKHFNHSELVMDINKHCKSSSTSRTDMVFDQHRKISLSNLSDDSFTSSLERNGNNNRQIQYGRIEEVSEEEEEEEDEYHAVFTAGNVKTMKEKIEKSMNLESHGILTKNGVDEKGYSNDDEIVIDNSLAGSNMNVKTATAPDSSIDGDVAEFRKNKVPNLKDNFRRQNAVHPVDQGLTTKDVSSPEQNDLPEFDVPVASDEEDFYDDEEIEILMTREDSENANDISKENHSESAAGYFEDTPDMDCGEFDQKHTDAPETIAPPIPAPRKRSFPDNSEMAQDKKPHAHFSASSTIKPASRNRLESSHSFSSLRSCSSVSSSRSSRFDPVPIDQITMRPPSVPIISVMTWDDRRKRLLEQKEEEEEAAVSPLPEDGGGPREAASFSRGNSFRMGMRRSKKEPRIRKPALPLPEVEVDKSLSPLPSGSEASSLSSPSLMSSSSTNPKAIDQLPPHVKAEELRLDLGSLQMSDSDAARSSISDFKSLETSMEPSLESSYL